MKKSMISKFGIVVLLSQSPAGFSAPGAFTDSVIISDDQEEFTFLSFSNGNTGPAQRWTLGNNLLTQFGFGGNEFGIADGTAQTLPFRILPGAPSFSLNLGSDGNTYLGSTDGMNPVGSRLNIGDTAFPSTHYYVSDSQDSWIFGASSQGGWIAEDVNSSAALRFLVNPGGYIGIGEGTGITAPPGRLSVLGDSAMEEDVQIVVDNKNSATAGTAKNLFVIKNNGPAKFAMFANDTDEWAFNARANEFRISKQGSGNKEMEVRAGGDLVITGSLTEGSSRHIKHNIVEVDSQTVLEKVVALPISEWTYNHDADGARHLGPMAEDFYQAFGLGDSSTGLASIDTSGVALASIKGLHQRVVQEEAEVDQLKQENSILRAELQAQEDRVTQLEMAVLELIRNNNAEVQVGLAR